MISFLTYFILFVVHCLSLDRPQSLANNELSKRAELYVSDTISLTKRLDPNFLEKDKPYKVWCIAEGNPLKRPHLVFCPCVLEQGEQCNESETCVELEEDSEFDTAQIETNISTYRWEIVASLNATNSSTFKCKVDAASAQPIPFVVTDIVDSQKHSGFIVELVRSDFKHQEPDDVYLHDSAVLNCKIQKYNDKGGVKWYFKPNSTSSWKLLKEDGMEERQSTNYSHVYQLQLNDIQLDQSGGYKCERNVSNVSRERNLKVLNSTKPSERNTTIDRDLYFRYTTNAVIKCNAQGVPFPKITWSKDRVPLSERYELSEDNTTITIGTVVAEDEGTYLCTMENPAGKSTAEFRVHVTGLSPLRIVLLSTGLGVLAIIIVALFIVLFVIRRNLKKQVKLLHNLQYSLHNSTDIKDINLLKPINEQPENLSFKNEFSLPEDSLNMALALKIDSGYFGAVYTVPLKAANNPTVIAKKVQRYSFELHEQFISEVKIMMYIGDHVNVLSLIGAITTQLEKGILWILTEFCEKGSLFKIVEKMRERFIREDAPAPESAPNQGPSTDCSTANGYGIPQSFNANEHRFHGAEHDSDEDLCTADLLCYLYQVANGMVFLSSRKIIHRDLAARNIFITRNNFVRIADFGLSRRGENYQIKKSMDTPLPIAHLAPEALILKKFSEKSDVWSFGILLFETFSLGEDPYPMYRDFNREFLVDLKNGLHPNYPQYSSNEMNLLMKKCWQRDAIKRPDHVECRSIIQDQLESHCSVCWNNLNVALNDDANKPDFSGLRKEFEKHQPSGHEVPKSKTKFVQKKQDDYTVVKNFHKKPDDYTVVKNFNKKPKKVDPASKSLINPV